uniref:serine/threonine-protein kinase haspin n=1 Tax=Jaculus jaculus TaxID=51337 RepID=UPI001E1B2368|nr:serine/threonine-protein kinase haspin [Jaculus jaculus]
MAASVPRARNRLFRTYGARGACCGSQRQPGRAVVQWFSPKDRKRFFSSSSSCGDPSPSVASDDPDDPDFPGSPVRRPRPRRRGDRRTQPTATPRRPGLRARPPHKCSTPCGPLRPPPFPGHSPGCFHPDLSVDTDGDELGTSASLFSSPVSADPPSPLAASTVHSGFHRPEASLDPASLPCPREAATEDGKFTRMVHRAGASLRSAFINLVDSGTPENSDFGTDGKDGKESYCERLRMRNRPEGRGLPSTGKRASDQSYEQGAGGIDYGEASACKDALGPGEVRRPKRTSPSHKRKHLEAVKTSVSHYHHAKRKGKDSFPSQDLTHSQNWTKTRASFSFHKKKIVTDVSELCSRSFSESFLSEHSNSAVVNRTNSSLSPWHSSSMYLLSPLKTLHVADKKVFDAEKVYGECNQEGPVPFSYCLSTEKLEHCEKIGEGVFGEVFQTITDHLPVALKVIAIEGPDLVNGSHQKTFEEILPEIIISKELSLLSNEACNRTTGFIGLNSVHCVQGRYPPLLLKAWDHYNSTKGSANDRPDFFREDQLFIILEFEFGGVDLEQMRTKLSSVATAKSILHQITASLAVAEASLHFEHRDLHWGNVLLKKTNLKELQYTLNGQTNTIPTCGLQVNIIDYTLSRLERDGIVVFCDISSEEDLFTGEGDYQFEIYRLMRKENDNCWGEYHPYNNVLWLHYLSDKILNHMRFKRGCQTNAMKQVKKKLQHFHRTVLNFSSATDLLCQHSLFK